MADIFLSYARADLATARQFEQALEERGWSVFWDRELAPGADHRDAIQRELNQASCVIVLWSRNSVESEWVIDQARDGLRRGRLLPVLLDDVYVPFGLQGVQSASLVNWSGDTDAPEFRQVLRSLNAVIPGAPSAPASASPFPADATSASWTWWELAAWGNALAYVAAASAVLLLVTAQVTVEPRAAGVLSTVRALTSGGFLVIIAGVGVFLIRQSFEFVAAVGLVRKLRHMDARGRAPTQR